MRCDIMYQRPGYEVPSFMETAAEPFSLSATFHTVLDAFVAIVCNIGFQVATAGLFVALVIGLIGLVSINRQKKAGRPLVSVFRKVAIFCLVLAVPGGSAIVASGHLPQVNQLVLNPFGLVAFWSLIAAHLCMEEMNFQWFRE